MSQMCQRCYRIVPRRCQSDTETMDCPHLQTAPKFPRREPSTAVRPRAPRERGDAAHSDPWWGPGRGEDDDDG